MLRDLTPYEKHEAIRRALRPPPKPDPREWEGRQKFWKACKLWLADMTEDDTWLSQGREQSSPITSAGASRARRGSPGRP